MAVESPSPSLLPLLLKGKSTYMTCYHLQSKSVYTVNSMRVQEMHVKITVDIFSLAHGPHPYPLIVIMVRPSRSALGPGSQMLRTRGSPPPWLPATC